MRLRNTHCVEVFQQVNQEVAKIVSNSKEKGKSTEDMSLQDMADLIRNMPKQEEMMKVYKIHIDLLQKVISAITQSRIQKII